MSKHFIIHTDGGSRGNPGEAAVGIVIEEKNAEGKIVPINNFGKRIGIATNNVAEYRAVVEALKYLITLHENNATYDLFLDSLLVVQQLNGVYKVKDANLQKLVRTVRDLERQLGGVLHYTAVRREANALADKEVNKALD